MEGKQVSEHHLVCLPKSQPYEPSPLLCRCLRQLHSRGQYERRKKERIKRNQAQDRARHASSGWRHYEGRHCSCFLRVSSSSSCDEWPACLLAHSQLAADRDTQRLDGRPKLAMLALFAQNQGGGGNTKAASGGAVVLSVSQ